MTDPSHVHQFYSGDHYDLDASLGKLMRKVTESIARSVDARMVDDDLTNKQWAPLLLLAHKRCSTAAGMTRALDIDSGAMTRMIDRLEAKGFIRRVPSKTDRRVMELELTAAGHRIADRVPYALADTLNEHLVGFTQAEFETLLALLKRMLANGQFSRDLMCQEKPNE